MASMLYNNALKEFALGNIVWKASGGSTIKAILVDAGKYTANASHKFLSEVASGARVGTAQTLSLVDAADGGVCDAADVTFSDLTSTPTVEAVVLYKDTGTESTSPLIAFIDSGTGLPTPAGVNSIIVRWDNGANRIFKL